MTSARFDDLRPRHQRGFSLGPISAVISAYRAEDVPGALAEVAEMVERGSWVGGWIAYEAAPAFDPALTVNSYRGTPWEGLPLVWFAVSDSRVPAAAFTDGDYSVSPWEPLTTPEHHRESVEHIHRRIAAGDTYQVNHTFPLRSRFEGAHDTYYRDLIRSQSCGYGALIETPRWIVASASPELFFEWSGDTIACRPMKGTVRRGVDVEEDAKLRKWLEHSEKNRAENVMIVDMVRNDLGRVAAVGSVQTPALFATEKYDTLWQLTSTVTARPRPGTGLVEVFEALFPSASITGAPKVSTMGIIADLEPYPRGVYCGAVGFGGPGTDGPEWAFNVGIRTVLIDRNDGTALYGIGGGITWDSEPGDEYKEAVLKAQILNRPRGEMRLLETTLWEPTAGARHWSRHLARLQTSAEYFDVPLRTDALDEALERAVADRTTPARLRVLVDRSGNVDIVATEPPPLEPGPLRLRLDDRPVDRHDPLLYHKTTNRRVYEDASARHPDADDVILWNDSQEITETTIGNIAVLIDGRWLTPPVSSGLLAGTERAWHLEQGAITESVITISDLEVARGFARLNSVRGWQEATLV